MMRVLIGQIESKVSGQILFDRLSSAKDTAPTRETLALGTTIGGDTSHLQSSFHLLSLRIEGKKLQTFSQKLADLRRRHLSNWKKRELSVVSTRRG